MGTRPVLRTVEGYGAGWCFAPHRFQGDNEAQLENKVRLIPTVRGSVCDSCTAVRVAVFVLNAELGARNQNPSRLGRNVLLEEQWRPGDLSREAERFDTLTPHVTPVNHLRLRHQLVKGASCHPHPFKTGGFFGVFFFFFASLLLGKRFTGFVCFPVG